MWPHQCHSATICTKMPTTHDADKATEVVRAFGLMTSQAWTT
jgi:hypothetical protein